MTLMDTGWRLCRQNRKKKHEQRLKKGEMSGEWNADENGPACRLDLCDLPADGSGLCFGWKTAGPLPGYVRFQCLKEGHCLDLGGKRFLVLHCPGHTPGSIALLDEEEKLLFSGDTVSLGPVYMFGRNRRPSVYLETLKRLWTMAEEGRFSLVYPHHNTAPIPAEKIRTLIECMEGILQGTLDGEPAGLKIPGSEMVKLYQKEDCGIYY